jgi:hypothetical protein
MITTTKVYYLISVGGKCLNKDFLGLDNGTLWLGEDSDYPSLVIRKEWAKRFKSVPKDIMSWGGCPWYYEIIPNTEKIYKVVETHTIEETII